LVKEGPKGKDYVYTLNPWNSLDYPRDIRLIVTPPRGEVPISLMVKIGRGYRRQITQQTMTQVEFEKAPMLTFF
jgi:hypothetical protein